MICITKNNIEEKLEDVRTATNLMLDDERIIYIDLLTEKQYKSRKQNNTFHSLLDCFWKSGCSSFVSENAMRFYYKRSVGLIETVFDNSNLEQDTKNMIWKAVQLLPISNTQLMEVVNLLKGKVVKEMSWSIATKQQATKAIGMILDDMDNAGVITSAMGKKYEEILGGLGEFRG
jgi:hypothetical protein